MIRKKIEAIPEEDRRMLRYASVQGEEFLSIVLAGSLGIDSLDLEEVLDRLGRVNRLIKAVGEERLTSGTITAKYRFSHSLYQNVLYGDLVSSRCRDLHRRAGELLVRHYGDESQRIAVQLAMHFEQGRDVSRTIEYLILAGDNAARVHANIEAEQHYTHALGFLEEQDGEVLATGCYLQTGSGRRNVRTLP